MHVACVGCSDDSTLKTLSALDGHPDISNSIRWPDSALAPRQIACLGSRPDYTVSREINAPIHPLYSILQAAKSGARSHGCRWVQFPFNLGSPIQASPLLPRSVIFRFTSLSPYSLLCYRHRTRLLSIGCCSFSTLNSPHQSYDLGKQKLAPVVPLSGRPLYPVHVSFVLARSFISSLLTSDGSSH